MSHFEGERRYTWESPDEMAGIQNAFVKLDEA